MTRFRVQMLVWSLRSLFRTRGALVIENLALRQQLAAYTRCHKRVRVEPQERMFWVALSKMWTVWRSALVIVKPETVIAWHRRGFQRYWRLRSLKPGRPSISKEHIALIRRISSDHPEWGTRKIVHINVTTSPSRSWVKQQIRQFTPWSNVSRFLLHDNEGIFGQYRDGRQRGEKCLRYRSHHAKKH